MFSAIGTEPAELFGAAMRSTIADLQEQSGFDAIRDPAFWESWLAVQFGAEQTAQKAGVDLRVTIAGRECTAEVKFSNAFFCRFTQIRGADWSRHMFKWALTRPQEHRREADAILLIGVDVDSKIYSWAVPYSHVPAGRLWISITAPSNRRTRSVGRIDAFSAPVTELLPAFARLSHGLDAPMRRVNASKTIHRKRGQDDLFIEEPRP